MINGNEVVLAAQGIRIGAAKSVSISMSNALVEATLGDTESWREVITGVKSASLSFEGLVDYDDLRLETFLTEGTRVSFRQSTGTFHLSGQGYVNSISHTGASDGVATYSGSITLTGELSRELNTIINTLCLGDETLCLGAETLCGPEEDI